MCVPFYVLHKMLAGLLDQHTRAKNPQALAMVTGLADWTAASVEAAIATHGIAKWQGVLNTEWGGMNDALYQASRGDPSCLSGIRNPLPTENLLKGTDGVLRPT